MRTTLTLDNDLAVALKAAARRDGVPFKTVVNDAIRRGLATGDKPATRRERFRVPSAPRGFLPGVDPLKLNQLLDEMEADDFLQRPHGTPPDARS